jgi:hypothetical protein
MRKLHVHQGAPAEIDPEWKPVPEKQREQAGHAEDQGEGKEVPFLAQEIDVRIAEEFHFVDTLAPLATPKI